MSYSLDFSAQARDEIRKIKKSESKALFKNFKHFLKNSLSTQIREQVNQNNYNTSKSQLGQGEFRANTD